MNALKIPIQSDINNSPAFALQLVGLQGCDDIISGSGEINLSIFKILLVKNDCFTEHCTAWPQVHLFGSDRLEPLLVQLSMNNRPHLVEDVHVVTMTGSYLI